MQLYRPILDKNHLIKQVLDIGDEVRGDDNGGIFAPQARQKAQKLFSKNRIYTYNGLIKQIKPSIAR